MSGEPVAQFSNRVLGFLDANPVRALVIDLRHNSGGSSSIIEPLIEGLERRPLWSRGDGLYAIVGRATFSSAVLNAFAFRDRTRAALVGEPTGGKPNHFGEVRSFDLPNPHLTATYSTRFFRLVSDADPPSLEPDIRVGLSSKDFIDGGDPSLETILDFAGRWPFYLPSVAWVSLVGIGVSLPGVPGSAFLTERVQTIDVLPAATPCLVYAGLALTATEIATFRHSGWRLSVVAVLVFAGTYTASAMIAEVVSGMLGRF